MKKSFKYIIGILLLISIISFLFVYYYIYIYLGSNKELLGKKITNGIYLYNLDTFNGADHGINIVDDNIYYWILINNKYEFYKINIYKNEIEYVDKFDLKDYYCYFESNYIDCSNDSNKKMYDYKFKKIYDGDNKVVIPYKKDLIKIDKNIAYYKDKEYKKLNRDFSNLNMYQYFSFDNNAYIFFAGLEEEDCLLNLEDNICEKYEYTSVKQYENGLYFIDKEKLRVLNINNKEIKEYNNYIKDEYLTTSALNENILYYFLDDYLRIYNLETGKVNLFDYRINEDVDEVYLSNDLLYLVTTDKVYVIKLDEILTTETTAQELEAKLESIISNKIKKINDDYGVEIKIRKDANLKFKVFKESTKGETKFDNINDSLDYAEEVFKILGKDFFKEFVHDEYTGLRVYLVSDIKADIGMDGEQLRYYDKYAIIAKSYNFRRILCHELMHAIEDGVVTKGKEIFNKWDSYNPKGFKYKEKYDSYSDPYKYTVEYKKGDIYFIDNYAQTNEQEDRARIFENICMNTTSDIKNNSHLFNKANYLEEEVIKYYPMLKESTIFDSLK